MFETAPHYMQEHRVKSRKTSVETGPEAKKKKGLKADMVTTAP